MMCLHEKNKKEEMIFLVSSVNHTKFFFLSCKIESGGFHFGFYINVLGFSLLINVKRSKFTMENVVLPVKITISIWYYFFLTVDTGVGFGNTYSVN